jgi:hypothetical protein
VSQEAKKIAGKRNDSLAEFEAGVVLRVIWEAYYSKIRWLLASRAVFRMTFVYVTSAVILACRGSPRHYCRIRGSKLTATPES